MKNDMEPMEFEQELEQEKEEKLRLETISMSNAVTTRKGGRAIHTMTVIGQVEGHYLLGDGQKSTKYEQIIPLLVSVEESIWRVKFTSYKRPLKAEAS